MSALVRSERVCVLQGGPTDWAPHSLHRVFYLAGGTPANLTLPPLSRPHHHTKHPYTSTYHHSPLHHHHDTP